MKGFGKMAVCLSLMGRRSRLRRAGRVPGLLSHPVPPYCVTRPVLASLLVSPHGPLRLLTLRPSRTYLTGK